MITISVPWAVVILLGAIVISYFAGRWTKENEVQYHKNQEIHYFNQLYGKK